MTDLELKKELDRISAEEAKERAESDPESQIGLDGPITSKYRKIRRALFDKYEQEKKD